MIIAKEKRKNNIAEYILYMWHIEDMLRILKLNFDLVKSQLVEKYEVDDELKKEIADWYFSLITMMERENLSNGGHLLVLEHLVDEMDQLHHNLVKSNKHKDYVNAFMAAKSDIEIFRVKSRDNDSSDIKVGLNALRSILLLKMSKKEITEATNESLKKISNFLAVLSKKFKEQEELKLEL
jgi:translation elongation factor EF-1beta